MFNCRWFPRFSSPYRCISCACQNCKTCNSDLCICGVKFENGEANVNQAKLDIPNVLLQATVAMSLADSFSVNWGTWLWWVHPHF